MIKGKKRLHPPKWHRFPKRLRVHKGKQTFIKVTNTPWQAILPSDQNFWGHNNRKIEIKLITENLSPKSLGKWVVSLSSKGSINHLSHPTLFYQNMTLNYVSKTENYSKPLTVSICMSFTHIMPYACKSWKIDEGVITHNIKKYTNAYHDSPVNLP